MVFVFADVAAVRGHHRAAVFAGDDPDPLCGDRDRRSAADGSAVLLFAGEP